MAPKIRCSYLLKVKIPATVTPCFTPFEIRTGDELLKPLARRKVLLIVYAAVCNGGRR